MNSRNDAVRQYLGVDKFHAAGYTGKRARVLTGEEKTVDHGANTRLAFLEIAPDAEIAYAPFPLDNARVEKFHALRGDACCMFVSLSGPLLDRKLTDAAVPDDLFLCVSAGNEGEDESNHMMRPENVYGVGAVELRWSAMTNGRPKDGATAIVEAADYSSTSNHVDFAAPTALYLSGIKKFNGTSCACPVLVGMAALVNDFFIHKTGKPLTHAAMYRFLKDHTEDVEIPGKDEKTGWGIPRLPDPESIDIRKYQPEEETNPKEEKPMKILLIAGHGAGDPGAVSTVAGKSYKEADEARALVRSLVTSLTKAGVEATTYNLLRNAYADYKEGSLSRLAKFSEYDLVLEIHFNAFALDEGNGKTKGVEAYVTTAAKNTAAAEAMCRHISALGFTNRGVKRKNYSVISTADAEGVSSTLLEVCFLDDADDMALYEKSREAVVQAVTAGICEAYSIQKPTEKTARQIVQEKAGLEDKTMDYLAAYTWGKDLIEKLAKAMM